jgi:hypothetical protein
MIISETTNAILTVLEATFPRIEICISVALNKKYLYSKILKLVAFG